MDPVSHAPEGSNQEQHTSLDLTASTRWAYGMPLSYVHEVANQWLRISAPAGEVTSPGTPKNDGPAHSQDPVE